MHRNHSLNHPFLKHYFRTHKTQGRPHSLPSHDVFCDVNRAPYSLRLSSSRECPASPPKFRRYANRRALRVWQLRLGINFGILTTMLRVAGGGITLLRTARQRCDAAPTPAALRLQIWRRGQVRLHPWGSWYPAISVCS